ncbi:putative rnp domain protein [Phaeomoniella chlamydospora]|uniref:Putative rnp domain protein n=1 Tax=Phaeomoniella chlamydospora TaxID=158046 RepID=A0A0G2HHG4_PHACM|nr:putative rnp domain protein [Phaeomoniella chlamydospora]
MSYPPPPGLRSTPTSNRSASATPQPHASLPPRPPPSAVGPPSSFKPAFSSVQAPAYSAPGIGNYGGGKPSSSSSGYNAFTAFAPRSVASPSFRNNASSPTYAAPPQTSYSSAPQLDPQAANSYGSSGYNAPSYGAAPSIQNPFPLPGQGPQDGYGAQGQNFDPDMEAQIAQWQSAYGSRDETTKSAVRKDGVPAASTSRSETSTPDANTAAKTVVRSGGGQTWQDSTLLEWDPAHFRLFVGNLAGEVTDDSLLKAFSKYPSVQKARVIRDKRTTKSKGYGFVSFSDGDEYFQAARDMQGKYIGSHPVLLRRSTTEIRPSANSNKGHKGKNHGKGGGGAGGKVFHGGIEKKQPKTKGGLKLLG